MTRELQVVDSRDTIAVWRALRAALTADGPAILPHDGTPHGLPATVAQRTALVIETSGSTGRPKRVELSADALLASAAAAHSALGGPGDWLLALPATYIAGINVMVREIASESDMHAMNLSRGFTVQGFIGATRHMEAERRYTSLVPAQLARLIEADEALETLRRFDGILVGGQAVPIDLAARALELGLNIVRTYGSSETSGGCVYDGVPIGDTAVRIVDGRIELSGSVLAEGYLDDPKRTAFAFRDGWYRTDDTGELVDGILRVTGRVDDVIVSGGVKVSLAAVELAVRGIAGLATAVVVAAPHPEWGESPVVVSDTDVPLDQVRATVAAELGAPAAPARIVLVDAVPMLASGKPDRVALAAIALR
ncbi:o-succinylbenzoate--CoA ligase [soil metagenome]